MIEPKFKYLNITVPISEQEGRDVEDGEEFSWVFHTEEEPNTIIRVRVISQEKAEEIEGEEMENG